MVPELFDIRRNVIADYLTDSAGRLHSGLLAASKGKKIIADYRKVRKGPE